MSFFEQLLSDVKGVFDSDNDKEFVGPNGRRKRKDGVKTRDEDTLNSLLRIRRSLWKSKLLIVAVRKEVLNDFSTFIKANKHLKNVRVDENNLKRDLTRLLTEVELAVKASIHLKDHSDVNATAKSTSKASTSNTDASVDSVLVATPRTSNYLSHLSTTAAVSSITNTAAPPLTVVDEYDYLEDILEKAAANLLSFCTFRLGIKLRNKYMKRMNGDDEEEGEAHHEEGPVDRIFTVLSSEDLTPLAIDFKQLSDLNLLAASHRGCVYGATLSLDMQSSSSANASFTKKHVTVRFLAHPLSATEEAKFSSSDRRHIASLYRHLATLLASPATQPTSNANAIYSDCLPRIIGVVDNAVFPAAPATPSPTLSQEALGCVKQLVGQKTVAIIYDEAVQFDLKTALTLFPNTSASIGATAQNVATFPALAPTPLRQARLMQNICEALLQVHAVPLQTKLDIGVKLPSSVSFTADDMIILATLSPFTVFMTQWGEVRVLDYFDGFIYWKLRLPTSAPLQSNELVPAFAHGLEATLFDAQFFSAPEITYVAEQGSNSTSLSLSVQNDIYSLGSLIVYIYSTKRLCPNLASAQYVSLYHNQLSIPLSRNLPFPLFSGFSGKNSRENPIKSLVSSCLEFDLSARAQQLAEIHKTIGRTRRDLQVSFSKYLDTEESAKAATLPFLQALQTPTPTPTKAATSSASASASSASSSSSSSSVSLAATPSPARGGATDHTPQSSPVASHKPSLHVRTSLDCNTTAPLTRDSRTPGGRPRRISFVRTSSRKTPTALLSPEEVKAAQAGGQKNNNGGGAKGKGGFTFFDAVMGAAEQQAIEDAADEEEALFSGIEGKVVEKIGPEFLAGSYTAKSSFSKPVGMALDPVNGFMFVCDQGNCRLVVLKRDTSCDGDEYVNPLKEDLRGTGYHFYKYIGTRGSEPHKASFLQPCGVVAIPKKQELFICDRSNNRVLVLDYHGNFKRNAAVGPGSKLGLVEKPTALGLNFDHTLLFICEEANARVSVYNAHGGFLRVLTHRRMKKPSAVCCSEEGIVYVADSEANLIFLFWELPSQEDLDRHEQFGTPINWFKDIWGDTSENIAQDTASKPKPARAKVQTSVPLFSPQANTNPLDQFIPGPPRAHQRKLVQRYRERRAKLEKEAQKKNNNQQDSEEDEEDGGYARPLEAKLEESLSVQEACIQKISNHMLPLCHPSGLYIDNYRQVLIISDMYHGRLVVLDSFTGEYLGQISTDTYDSIMLSKKGRNGIIENFRKRSVINTNGGGVAAAGNGATEKAADIRLELEFPLGLAVDEKRGIIFVSDVQRDEIYGFKVEEDVDKEAEEEQQQKHNLLQQAHEQPSSSHSASGEDLSAHSAHSAGGSGSSHRRNGSHGFSDDDDEESNSAKSQRRRGPLIKSNSGLSTKPTAMQSLIASHKAKQSDRGEPMQTVPVAPRHGQTGAAEAETNTSTTHNTPSKTDAAPAYSTNNPKAAEPTKSSASKGTSSAAAAAVGASASSSSTTGAGGASAYPAAVAGSLPTFMGSFQIEHSGLWGIRVARRAGPGKQEKFIFVADERSNLVQVCNAEGEVVASIGIAEDKQTGLLKGPKGIEIDDAQQEIYVVDSGHHRVCVYSIVDYELRRTFGDKPNGGSGEEGLFSSGLSFIANSFSSNEDGSDKEGMLKYPTDIAVDVKRDRVYVTDTGNNRINLYTLAGVFKKTIGIPGEGVGLSTPLNKPLGLAYDASVKRIYVCDAGNNRVVTFDSKGRMIRERGSSGTKDLDHLNAPTSCTLVHLPPSAVAGFVTKPLTTPPTAPANSDELTHLLITDRSNSRVTCLELQDKKKFISFFGGKEDSSEDRRHELAKWLPTGITCDRENGILYVTDSKGQKVSVFMSSPELLEKAKHKKKAQH